MTDFTIDLKTLKSLTGRKMPLDIPEWAESMPGKYNEAGKQWMEFIQISNVELTDKNDGWIKVAYQYFVSPESDNQTVNSTKKAWQSWRMKKTALAGKEEDQPTRISIQQLERFFNSTLGRGKLLELDPETGEPGFLKQFNPATSELLGMQMLVQIQDYTNAREYHVQEPNRWLKVQ